jgi:hypothetical protein
MDNDVIIERLENLLRENSEEHKSILDQVKKTNGSVADIQKWRYLLTGGFIVSNIIIVPIIITLILKLVR